MRTTYLIPFFLLVGCNPEPLGATAEDDDPFNDELVTCAGGRLDPVPGYPAFRVLEVELPDGEIDAANWVWSPAAAVRVNVDLASFAGLGFSDAQILDAVGRANHFWNTAAAGFNLLVGDTGTACCTEEDDGDCTACDSAEEGAYLYVAEASELGVPASTRTRYGDNPSSVPIEIGCLVGAEVRFFERGMRDDGTPLNYRWVYDSTQVADLDPSDGTVDKPFYETLVHEFGHVLGLGEQSDPSVECSVMGHYADPACGEDFETAGPIDAAALQHVYRMRR